MSHSSTSVFFGVHFVFCVCHVRGFSTYFHHCILYFFDLNMFQCFHIITIIYCTFLSLYVPVFPHYNYHHISYFFVSFVWCVFCIFISRIFCIFISWILFCLFYMVCILYLYFLDFLYHHFQDFFFSPVWCAFCIITSWIIFIIISWILFCLFCVVYSFYLNSQDFLPSISWISRPVLSRRMFWICFRRVQEVISLPFFSSPKNGQHAEKSLPNLVKSN